MKNVVCKKEQSGLEKGKMYKVLYENPRRDKTYYILEGIIGEFDSEMFFEQSMDPEIKIGITNKIPIVGESSVCWIMKEGRMIKELTSLVRQIEMLNYNTFQFKTLDYIYIIQIQEF